MRIAMEEVARKLTLWHTPTFRPLYTHDDLDPIMAAAGFVPLPLLPSSSAAAAAGGGGGRVVAWREYEFGGRSGGGGGCQQQEQERTTRTRRRKEHEPCPSPCPRPRLPYPRIDGLHLFAYEAFFHALDFYLGPHRVPDLFHVRSMPLTRSQDVADGAYRHMRDCNMEDEGIYVFRDGTLDSRTKMDCSSSSSSSNVSNGNRTKAGNDTGNSSLSTYLVPLEDLFPSSSTSHRDIVSLG